MAQFNEVIVLPEQAPLQTSVFFGSAFLETGDGF